MLERVAASLVSRDLLSVSRDASLPSCAGVNACAQIVWYAIDTSEAL